VVINAARPSRWRDIFCRPISAAEFGMLDLAVDAATITTLTPSCFAVGLAPMVASSAQKRW
jgi:hypothetical protein